MFCSEERNIENYGILGFANIGWVDTFTPAFQDAVHLS